MPQNSFSPEKLDSFYQYLSEVLAGYRDLVPVLKEELDIILRDDIGALNENLKTQQLLVYKTRDFDGKTAAHLGALGIDARSVTEFALQLPESEQLRFFGLVGSFERVVSEVLFYKEKCREMLQSRLYRINRSLEALDHRRESATYDENAAEVSSGLLPKAFEKKV